MILRKIFSLIFIFFGGLGTVALLGQTRTEVDTTELEMQECVITSFQEEEEEVYTLVDKMPEFIGGHDSLKRYLGRNINYPLQAKNNGIEGVVYVTFLIRNNGEVSNVRLLRGIGGGCDEEAIQVISKMPNWTPGSRGGKKVNVQFNMPIVFKVGINKEKKK